MNINNKKSPRSTPSSPLATCLSVPDSPEQNLNQNQTQTQSPIITPLDLSNIREQNFNQENMSILQDIKTLKSIITDMKEQELISPRVKILANTRAILQNTSNILSINQINQNTLLDDINQIHKRLNACMRLQEDILDINMKILYKVNKICDELEQK
jgi:hypothetical protein